MQMRQAQQSSTELNHPTRLKSIQQAGHIDEDCLLWMKCWNAVLQNALSLITHLPGP